MLIYMAPMEGITGYIYRNTFASYFGGVDKYFMPFIEPAKGRPIRNRELRDVLPENNRGMRCVPQILTNSVDGYVRTARYLKDLGYTEVNINLGCPSGTVVSKCKGAGLLYDIHMLDEFLYGVFEADVMDVSVKTRIGKETPSEFADIIEVYRKYPIKELIIHPRFQKDFYRNTPRMEVFEEGVALYGRTDNVCYNGDIWGVSEYESFTKTHPDINMVMLGRGLIGNPFIAEDIKSYEETGTPGCSSYDRKKGDRSGTAQGSDVDDKLTVHVTAQQYSRFFSFHEELYGNYCQSDVGRGNTLFKMKELWTYMACLFPHEEKLVKRIMKSKNNTEYEMAVNNLKRMLL